MELEILSLIIMEMKSILFVESHKPKKMQMTNVAKPIIINPKARTVETNP